ncbi:ABC transporter permease [Pedobacter sp. AW31-3R]|uniref:ABC transporter permease n=1 Tax=Pedobacter sp. AW31-3R TaxID=3445781 RepID=UPI003F9F3B83
MNINVDIANTYIFSGKKQTLIAALGVLLGMSIYIFMNCLVLALDRSVTTNVFKNTAHIRVYHEETISKELVQDSAARFIIVNPKVVPQSNTIIDPNMVSETILRQKEVTVVTPQVNVPVFYNNGKSQISGIAVGIKPSEANIMYNIKSTMVAGDFEALNTNPRGIVIGVRVAERMNLSVGDNLNLTSAKGVNRTYKVVGFFKTNIAALDKTKSYINLVSAQQLQKEGASYITDINVNITDPEDAKRVGKVITQLTGYKAESWQEANASIVAANKMRFIVISLVSSLILLVAGFGIYNILNMTVSQKINDIAILKAIGFRGKDVVKIFVTQAITIGAIGVTGGVVIALILVTILKNTYVGGDIGYFPIDYEGRKFIQGIVLGLLITFFAGYLPARKAAKVDPVAIFRK